ncbi:hypothetical protein DCC39_09070 [Pueribacillus theae]|uniref:Sulfatase N-terminal domain-containing protein n=1 Tax=Pueribacillus theae TaxID=2171751 RepID=A0A2U1K2Z0_9BACI|nr:LTA synthase family protein [Pueribacillus theae]PWA11782.1 hypothetical protein DCC39_09070 [Pueribacillus theae]
MKPLSFLRKHQLLFLAIFLFWVKAYIVQRFCFNTPTEGVLQGLLLLVNPLSSALLLFGISLFFSVKWRKLTIILISLLSSMILYSNVIYNRFFNDFITLPTLFQTNNMGDLGGSIFTLVQATDLFLFADVAFLLIIVRFVEFPITLATKKQINTIFGSALALFAFNLALSEIEQPQLLTKSFDRSMIIQNIGVINFHIYDLVMQSTVRVHKALAKSDVFYEVENFVNDLHGEPNPSFRGKAKGKNVFIISLESMQSFVLNRKMEGHEITPFLNDLMKESYYFPNFYHQTGQGKTSDAEFLVDNSLYPLPSGAVFFTHAENEYNGLPEIISREGYYPAVMHANHASFWNRDIMYDALGYKRYFSADDFEINENNSVGWGLKDIDMFEQSIAHLTSLPEPYYVKYLTITNHFPYALEKEDEFIPQWTSTSETVNRYFTTVRYTDEAVKRFFQRLKEEGVYENAIFIFYGDHYGISEYHNKELGEFLGKEITPFESVQLQRVPLLIHIPGEQGGTFDTIGGQIDLKPTILNLLGIDEGEDLSFGNDLFSNERPGLVVLRDGSFITEKYIYTKNKCYDKSNESEIEIEACEPFIEEAQLQLDQSDKVIYGDLLRFYENK